MIDLKSLKLFEDSCIPIKVFVAAHPKDREHWQQNEIIMEMEKVFNNSNIQLEFDENINVWNTNESHYHKYDTIFLPDLGTPEIIKPLNKLTEKEKKDLLCSFPLKGSEKCIDWQYFFTTHTLNDRKEVFIELVKMIKPNGYVYFSKFMIDKDKALRLTKESLMDGYKAEPIEFTEYIHYIRISKK